MGRSNMWYVFVVRLYTAFRRGGSSGPRLQRHSNLQQEARRTRDI